jgi:hypothetical protein
MHILLVALAVVGYRGISAVVENARISESVNAIGTQLTRTRIYVQGFIVSRTDAGVKKIRQALAKMTAEIVRAENDNSDLVA